MDSCDELEDQLLSVIQKSVEQRIQCKEINQDETIHKLVLMREKSRKNKMKELDKKRIEGKENAPMGERNSEIRSSAKSALKRLGALYTDGRISSPIHRTETNFMAEDEEENVEEELGGNSMDDMSTKSRPRHHDARNQARSARLAALANTINQWEDDLSHPVIAKPTTNKERNIPKKTFSQGNRGIGISSGTSKSTALTTKVVTSSVMASPAKSLASIISPTKTPTNRQTSTGQVAWDNAIIATLEAQGFARCESRQHLIYDYKDREATPAKCLSPGRSRTTQYKNNEQVKINQPIESGGTRDESPEKSRAVVNSNHADDNSDDSMATGDAQITKKPTPVRSPVKKTVVMAMAAQYEESTSPVKNCNSIANGKDPAELTLAERKALFEKNGGSAILPKAPFGMAIPVKILNENRAATKPCLPTRGPVRTEIFGGSKSGGGGLGARLAAFEKKCEASRDPEENAGSSSGSSHDETLPPARDPVKEEIERRKREVDQLRNRMAAKKEAFNVKYNPNDQPQNSRDMVNIGGSPKKTVISGSGVIGSPAPPPPPLPPVLLHDRDQYQDALFLCPSTRRSLNSSQTHNTSYPDMKRIRVSPPKPGRLYPSISDIETETESEIPEESDSNSRESSFEDDCSSISSLGGKIVKKASTSNLQRHSTMKRSSDSSTSVGTGGSSDESRVLQEIDDFLDEALGEPSPKRSRDSSFDDQIERNGMLSYPSGSCRSTSFEYSEQSEEQEENMEVVDQDSENEKPVVQLVHTISLYRKQQQNQPVLKQPVMTIKREPMAASTIESAAKNTDRSRNNIDRKTEEEMVGKKIHDLLIEVSRQQTIIAQASQALNLCCSTVEFAGSTEQIEGEKLLLIATSRRQACLHELERLRIEKSLRAGGGDAGAERGRLTVERISIPVKTDAIHQAAREEKCHHVVCLVRCGSTVAASDMITCTPKNLIDGSLRFVKPLVIEDVYADLAVTLEVYTLAAKAKELLPHDIKYHIAPSSSIHKKDRLRLTPKKGPKNDTKFLCSLLESPGGPQAVRSPAFAMAGFIVFSLRDINRRQFTLNKVPYGSVVEGKIELRISCDLSAEIEHRGFLTMFEDVSGFGAWHRRWCLLRGTTLSYWKYPEDEEDKIAMDTIDLSQCITREACLVSRDICARPNTFLLETRRQSRPGDVESLVLKSSGNTTTIRHLLSADTKDDRLEWCEQINRILALLRVWGKRPS